MNSSSNPEEKGPHKRIEELEALLDRLTENLDRVQRKLKEVGEILGRNAPQNHKENSPDQEENLLSRTDLNWLSTAI